ncbi:hypothetical protein SPHV1_2350017 [Novosphingobium sp. KN65.2]|nr:hypothetical protein SPHV1_2350017 [Novosphingobium sp. KN65.2]
MREQQIRTRHSDEADIRRLIILYGFLLDDRRFHEWLVRDKDRWRFARRDVHLAGYPPTEGAVRVPAS